MKKVIRLTESDLARIVRRVIKEDLYPNRTLSIPVDCVKKTIGGLDLTDQQFKSWCLKGPKTGTGSTSTNAVGGARTNVGSTSTNAVAPRTNVGSTSTNAVAPRTNVGGAVR